MKKLLLTATLAAVTLAAAPQANAGYLPCDDIYNTPDRAGLTCDAGPLGPLAVEYYRVHILGLAPTAAPAPAAAATFANTRNQHHNANRQACNQATAATRGRLDHDGSLQAAADYRFGCERNELQYGIFSF